MISRWLIIPVLTRSLYGLVGENKTLVHNYQDENRIVFCKIRFRYCFSANKCFVTQGTYFYHMFVHTNTWKVKRWFTFWRDIMGKSKSLPGSWFVIRKSNTALTVHTLNLWGNFAGQMTRKARSDLRLGTILWENRKTQNCVGYSFRRMEGRSCIYSESFQLFRTFCIVNGETNVIRFNPTPQIVIFGG